MTDVASAIRVIDPAPSVARSTPATPASLDSYWGGGHVPSH